MMLTRIKYLIAALVLSVQGVHAGSEITVVADEWPPFSGSDLPNGGISLDVISSVLERAGYNVNTQVLPWARIMSGARNSEYDIVGSLFYDPEVEDFMTYGAPFYQTEVRFVQRSGAGHQIDGLESLGDLSIAVGQGFLYEDRFDRADGLNKVVVTTTLQGIQMVGHGRVALTLDSVDVVNYATSVQDPSIADRVEVLPYVLATHGIHMAVRDDHPGRDIVVRDFNATLRAMRDDGSLAEILARHQ